MLKTLGHSWGHPKPLYDRLLYFSCIGNNLGESSQNLWLLKKYLAKIVPCFIFMGPSGGHFQDSVTAPLCSLPYHSLDSCTFQRMFICTEEEQLMHSKTYLNKIIKQLCQSIFLKKLTTIWDGSILAKMHNKTASGYEDCCCSEQYLNLVSWFQWNDICKFWPGPGIISMMRFSK